MKVLNDIKPYYKFWCMVSGEHIYFLFNEAHNTRVIQISKELKFLD